MESVSFGQRKVAIPRLQKTAQGQTAMKTRRRVPRACTACRSHKIKCTGEKPKCQHCASTGRDCVYIMPRKDRLKIVTEQCHQMAKLLRGFRTSANQEEDAKILELLEAVEEETSEIQQVVTPSNPDTEPYGFVENYPNVTNDQPSGFDIESLDFLDEDLHHERARPTGFVGKNSEIQWFRAVALAHTERQDESSVQNLSARTDSYAPINDQTSTFSYWADSEHVDVDFYVDAYELPPTETAECLLQCYMLKVHDSFPILPRMTFEDQFRRYFRAFAHGKAPRLSPKWQSILNLVFAISARYSHTVKACWRADDRDHLIYQARARTFSLDGSTITSHADVPYIQNLGLLAFYWLSVGQINRAWTAIGIALRAAYSLGLHVRNEDPSASAAKKESLVRTWWSVYSLERALSVITGRPSVIVESCCSVPLPIPIPEDKVSSDAEPTYASRKQSIALPRSDTSFTSGRLSGDHPDLMKSLDACDANSGSFFKAVIELSIITHSILTALYSAGTMIRSPNDIQQDVSHLGQRLDQWFCSLPTEFQFQKDLSGCSSIFARERMLLTFQNCSARMLLGRPYFSARSQISQEHAGETLARQMANACIEAARIIVYHLSDMIRPDEVFENGPWWCIVHHLMQAISVFLLGLSFPAATSQTGSTLVYYTKKAIHRLQLIQDPLADRAFNVAMSSFVQVAQRNSINISDFWTMSMANRLSSGEQLPAEIPDLNIPIAAYSGSQHVPLEPPALPLLYFTRVDYADFDMEGSAVSPNEAIPSAGTGLYHMAR